MSFKQAIRDAVWILLTEIRTSKARLMHELELSPQQLDDLLIELVEVKRWIRVDEYGLVHWLGSSSDLERQSHLLEPGQSHSEPQSEGERRQISVLFCDLVGSTALANDLDPEDMNELITAYQETVSPVIKQFDGYVAKFMGDGILAYYGYPQAREKDPQRAILSALAIVEAIKEFDRRRDPLVQVRIGIATGTVVVGELIGDGAAQERTVAGETPNLAARLQDAAPPNGIVISDVTHDLAGRGFEFQSLGEKELKGIPGPNLVWQVLRELDEDFSVETGATRENSPLVGRQEELGLLLRAWQQSKENAGQVVSISGEAGIGKSRMIEAISSQAVSDNALAVTLRCSPHHSNSAFYPLITQLRRALGWTSEDSDSEKLQKLETAVSAYQFPNFETVPLIAALLSLPIPDKKYQPLNLSPQQQRLNTLDTVLAWLLEEAEREPTIAVWEDLHWADPSTLELLDMMIEQCPTAPILNVVTFRPEFIPTWPARSHIVPITLNRLERPEVESLIIQSAKGKSMPAEVVAHIVDRADGVPLYVEELTTAILVSDALKEFEHSYELTSPLEKLTIPATLQDSLLARLDKAPIVREVAQLGAVLGREFPYKMVEAVGAFDEAALKDGLDQLVEEQLLYKRGRLPQTKYMFKHALIQDAAYQSLLKRTRQHYHTEVACLLRDRFPETAETQPEILAHHFSEAGEIEEALKYWLRAGQLALQRSENYEVIGHLNKGLALLPGGGKFAGEELAMLRPLGAAYMATRGYGAPETIETFDRARKLCSVVNDDGIYPVLFGVWLAALVQSGHEHSKELISEMHVLTENSESSYALLAAHAMSGFTYVHTGEQLDARKHFSTGIELARSMSEKDKNTHALIYGLDVEVANLAYSAWVEWFLGYPDTALDRQQLALQALKRSNHGYTQSRALYWCAVVRQLRGEWREVIKLTDRAIESARAHGLNMVETACRILSISSHAELGEPGSADDISSALDDYMATGAQFQTSYHRTLLAKQLAREGRVEEAFDALNKAHQMIQETGEDYFLAEVLRLKGELAMEIDGQGPDAEELVRQSISVSQAQLAKSLELRGAISLSRIMISNDMKDDALGALKPLVSWFEQGKETRDLCVANEMLSAIEA